tara:strand:+ start:459 stop:593 length:135 start_codon:yes stop_codon:yes gene_type:complete
MGVESLWGVGACNVFQWCTEQQWEEAEEEEKRRLGRTGGTFSWQ